MATERIDIVVSERGSRTVKRNLDEIGVSGAKTSRGLGMLKTALAGLGFTLAASQAIRLADSYTTITNRLRLVTTGTANLAAVNDRLFESANRTYASYESTAELYGSLARSTKTLGLSQEDLLGITETINQAIAVSGTEAATAANGLRQLGQGLASGTLRGDELNSVLENMPRLASAIADGMGVTVGQLRALGADGKITAENITSALKAAGPAVAAEFASINPTIANTFQVLTNNLVRFVGKLNEATGIGTAFGRLILWVANHLDGLAIIAGGLAAAFAWSSIVAGIQGVLGPMIALQRALGATSVMSALYAIAIKGATGAMRSFTAALLANPFTALLVAITAVIAAIVMFGDEIKVTEDGAVSLKDAFFGALLLIGDLVKTVAGAFLTAWDYTIGAVTGFLSSFGVSWQDIFSFIWMIVKGTLNALIGAFLAGFNIIQVAWNNFPGFMDLIFTNVVNLAIAAAELVVNAWQAPFRGIAALASYIDEDLASAINGGLDAMSVKLDRRKLSAAGRQAGQAIVSGAKTVFSEDHIGGFLDASIERGRGLGGGGVVDDTAGAAEVLGADGKGGKGGSSKDNVARELETRAGYLKKFKEEAEGAIKLSRVLDEDTRKVDEAVMSVNQHLAENKWEPLSSEEEKQFRELIRLREEENKLMGVRDSILKELRAPQQDYERHLKAATQLLAAGAINADQYTSELRKARMAYLELQRDTQSGLELGKLRVQDQQDNDAGRIANAYQSEWQNANGSMQELTDRVTVLKQLMQDDPMNSGVYAQRLREAGIEALILKGNMPDATVFDGMRAGLARFVQDFKGMMPGLSQAWGQWVQRIGDGFADAVGRAIVYGENLGDALSNVARSAMAELISSLVKLGIQWLIMQVIGQTAQKAMASTAAASGAAVATAWAPAAAAVSLATFGANGVPAGIAIAAVNALSLGFAQAGGGGKGFREGGYTGNGGLNEVAGVVHGKEFVVNAGATRDWLPMLEAINRGDMPTMGYRKGGYVSKRGPGQAFGSAFGSGAAEPRANVGGDTISISVDARGAENGVEDKIHEALSQAMPVFLAKARKQEAKVRAEGEDRQRIGN